MLTEHPGVINGFNSQALIERHSLAPAKLRDMSGRSQVHLKVSSEMLNLHVMPKYVCLFLVATLVQ